jgi:hypothetical protein
MKMCKFFLTFENTKRVQYLIKKLSTQANHDINVCYQNEENLLLANEKNTIVYLGEHESVGFLLSQCVPIKFSMGS